MRSMRSFSSVSSKAVRASSKSWKPLFSLLVTKISAGSMPDCSMA